MANPSSISGDSTVRASRGIGSDGKTTPENSFILPLTPPASDGRHAALTPAVKTVIGILENLQHDCLPTNGLATSFDLGLQQYSQLINALQDRPSLGSYVEDKVRVDYDPESESLNIRMPAPIHDFFATSVADEINAKLQAIVERGNETGEFAAQIRNGGSSRIILKEDTTVGEESEASGISLQRHPERHPDGQFQHCKAAYPGVVLEISYSQDGKDLEKLAWDYIQCSNGDIKAVIGIDINYGMKESTVSLWRPIYVHEDDEELDILDVNKVVAGEPFRAADGSRLNQDQVVPLMLSDFATDILSALSGSISLSITYKRLAELLDQAEQMHQVREQGRSSGIKSQRITRKRKRPSPSADLIRSDDEADFRRQEQRAMERVAAEDGDFRPLTRRRKP
uniref:Uncharacterized protein n=1 Tax=Bionectria ochroleuca TaxID=29856 RepID=A0A0B7KR42_BIOOC